jgi:hypothetical protein
LEERRQAWPQWKHLSEEGSEISAQNAPPIDGESGILLDPPSSCAWAAETETVTPDCCIRGSLLPARLNHLPQAGGINAIKYLVLEKWTALLKANEVTGFRFLKFA